MSSRQLTVVSPRDHDYELKTIHNGANDDGGNVTRRIFSSEYLGTNAVASAVSDEEHSSGHGFLCPARDVRRY